MLGLSIKVLPEYFVGKLLIVSVYVLLDAVRSKVAKANLASCLSWRDANLEILLCVLSAVPDTIPKLAKVALSLKTVSDRDKSYQVLLKLLALLIAVFNCATV